MNKEVKPVSILNVPIQLNRGNVSPSINSLYEGEPYFNLSTNSLYIKSNSKIDVNITGQSNSTATLKSKNNLFNFDINQNSCLIGGFTISENSWNASITTNINNIRIGNLGTTILSSEMYGKTFPSNPSNGQLFFKLAE